MAAIINGCTVARSGASDIEKMLETKLRGKKTTVAYVNMRTSSAERFEIRASFKPRSSRSH